MTLLQDLRYALRALLRAPGFALLATATLAIGIGANAAMFSVVSAVLLRPLPYPRANELLIVSMSNRDTRQSFGDASPANFLDWRVMTHSFGGLAAFRELNFSLSEVDHAERVGGASVSANYFDVIGVKPALGRGFVAADEQHGAPRVVILHDGFWRSRFAGRADAIGQTMRLDDETYTIVGVMAPGIEYPGGQLWVTPHWRVPDDPQLAPGKDPSPERGHSYFSVVGRLKAGWSRASAAADMDAVARALEREYPNDNARMGIALEPIRDELVADVRMTTLTLFGAVGVLLLIAAANVSGLLMARATARTQEIAIKMALGASRARIVSQLLTESVLLSSIGGSAGVLLAMWLITPLVALSPSDLTVAGPVVIDRYVLVFCAMVSTFVGVLFGLAPARHLSQVSLHEDLKQSARGAIGARQRRIRAALVSGEVALSLVLVVAAGLTVRSFVRVQRVPAGFDPDHVLTVTVGASPIRYGEQARRADLWERCVEALRAIPEVHRAGAISRLPLLPGNSTRGLTVPGISAAESAALPSFTYRTASPDYFEVMRIPIQRGRAFEDGDRENRPYVAIASSAAAERIWPGRDPIGEHFQIATPGPLYTVVGIAGDVRSTSLDVAPPPTIYVPYRQDAFPAMTFVVRSEAPAAAIAADVRAAFASVDRNQPIGAVRTMDEQMAGSLSDRRFAVTLLTAFGAAAMLLAAVGLYGVLAFVVSQRRREIGVRIALGASTRDVIVDVVGDGLRLAGIGLAAGVVLAAGVTRLMSALLFGTSPTDLATFAGAAVLLGVVAVAASLAPALRASSVDPLVALREE